MSKDLYISDTAVSSTEIRSNVDFAQLPPTLPVPVRLPVRLPGSSSSPGGGGRFAPLESPFGDSRLQQPHFDKRIEGAPSTDRPNILKQIWSYKNLQPNMTRQELSNNLARLSVPGNVKASVRNALNSLDYPVKDRKSLSEELVTYYALRDRKQTPVAVLDKIIPLLARQEKPVVSEEDDKRIRHEFGVQQINREIRDDVHCEGKVTANFDNTTINGFPTDGDIKYTKWRQKISAIVNGKINIDAIIVYDINWQRKNSTAKSILLGQGDAESVSTKQLSETKNQRVINYQGGFRSGLTIEIQMNPKTVNELIDKTYYGKTLYEGSRPARPKDVFDPHTIAVFENVHINFSKGICIVKLRDIYGASYAGVFAVENNPASAFTMTAIRKGKNPIVLNVNVPANLRP